MTYQNATKSTQAIFGSLDFSAVVIEAEDVITKGPTVDIRAFGVKGDGTDETVPIQSAIEFASTLHFNVLVPKGIYKVTALTIPDNIIFFGAGTILATDITKDVITIGNNVTISGITVQGTGSYDTTDNSGDPPALVKVVGNDTVIIKCTFINPPSCSILVTNVNGCKIDKNNFTCDYRGEITTVNLFHVYMYGSNNVAVTNNTITGAIEGICAGGNSNCRLTNIRVMNNYITGQKDHSIYFSSHCEGVTVISNNLISDCAPLKVEGGKILICFNTLKGQDGIVGRNVHDVVVHGNKVETTGETPYIYGLLFSDTVFKRPTKNIKITQNTFEHLGYISSAGIMIQGLVWAGYQSIISDVLIDGNTITGYGNRVEGTGISIYQQLFSGDPVRGSSGSDIIVNNNIINMPDTQSPTYGIHLLYGLTRCNISNNIINNFNSIGIRTLGVSNSIFTNNILNANSTTGTRYGLMEQLKNTSLLLEPVKNTYDGNKCFNLNAPAVMFSDETSRIVNKDVLVNSYATSSYTINPYQGIRVYVVTNPHANATVTFGMPSGRPWTINDEITIVNAHKTNSIFANGVVLIAEASAKFLNIGNNSFVRIS